MSSQWIIFIPIIIGVVTAIGAIITSIKNKNEEGEKIKKLFKEKEDDR